MNANTDMKDMVDLLVEDHQEIEVVFQQLQTREGSPQHRKQLADGTTAELVRHLVAEERYLYPTTRQTLDDGNHVADHELDTHEQADRRLKQLEGVVASEPRFGGLLDSLITDIRRHLAEEETDVFPRLRLRCSRDELLALGDKIDSAKKTAPTRPHPAAPDSPPANKPHSPSLGLVDRVRDVLTKQVGPPEDTSVRRGGRYSPDPSDRAKGGEDG